MYREIFYLHLTLIDRDFDPSKLFGISPHVHQHSIHRLIMQLQYYFVLNKTQQNSKSYQKLNLRFWSNSFQFSVYI